MYFLIGISFLKYINKLIVIGNNILKILIIIKKPSFDKF